MSSTVSSTAASLHTTESLPQGQLSGPSTRLDPRVNAFRPDLADVHLASRVVAARYARAALRRCGDVSLPMWSCASDDRVQVSTLLPGEDFAVFEMVGGYAWGQGASDGYVGYVASNGLIDRRAAADEVISAAQALVFARPSIKALVLATLPLGARVGFAGNDGDFHTLAAPGVGFIHRRHVAPTAGDPAGLASAFVATPYRWGGRTRDGIDCSGLTQIVLLAHGIACPRDSDQQRDAFTPVPFAERRRGDLVCLPGHIGILVDPATLLHANAFWMTTLAEPLADVVARQPDAQIVIVRPPCEATVRPL